MILRKLILLGALIGALVAGGVAVLCALVFTLHTLFAGWLGRAGGWALFFALVALALGGAAFLARAMAKGSKRKPAQAAEVPVLEIADRFAALVRERPVAAISTAVGAGVLAVRDPGRLAVAIRKFAAGAEVG